MNLRALQPGLYLGIWFIPVIVLLQAGLAGRFAVDGVLPSLVLIVVVDWGILRGVEEGLIWAFFAGLLLDVFTGWPTGTSTLALVVVAFVVSLGQGTFMRTHAAVPLVTVFGATILYYLVVMFVLESTHTPVDWLAALRSIALPAALYNLILNIPGYWLMQRLEQRVYPIPRTSW